MKKKKFRIPPSVIGVSIAVVLALLIWIFVDVSIEHIIKDKAGGCIAVVFDKPWVKGADRVLVHEDGQVITITDEEVVHQIADLFVVANCTALCSPGTERTIEIYNGDRLVRQIRQTQCGSDMYYIYECDLFHWILPEPYDGEVELSPEERQWLDGLIESYQQ